MRHKQKIIKFLKIQNRPVYIISFLSYKNVSNKVIIFSLCRDNNAFIQLQISLEECQNLVLDAFYEGKNNKLGL